MTKNTRARAPPPQNARSNTNQQTKAPRKRGAFVCGDKEEKEHLNYAY